jgi:nitroreductase
VSSLIVSSTIQRSALDQSFNEARTYNEWSEKPVDEQTVRELYDVLKWGPTSANCCPARFVWVRSPEGKAKLAAFAAEKNQSKVLAAPLTVIVGDDLDFADKMPKLFPYNGGCSRRHSRSLGSRRSRRCAMAACRVRISSSRRVRWVLTVAQFRLR